MRAPHTGERASARSRCASPAASSRSRAYSPIVCSIRSRSPWPSVCTRALSTSDSSSSRMVSPGSAQTASTSANVQPPAKTARRRNRRCSASVEQRVAPVDRGAQRLLPLGNVARAGCEDLEGVVETLEQRFRSQEPEPGGSELESERQAVQAPADRRDGLGVLRRQLERASGHLRALDEQRDRRIRAERLGRGRIGRRGKLQRVERVLPLGGDPEWRPARRHDLQPRAALDQAAPRPAPPPRPARGCPGAEVPSCHRSVRRRPPRASALRLPSRPTRPRERGRTAQGPSPRPAR